MATVYEYTLRCTTDGTDEKILLRDDEAAPTKCPTNTAHTIDLASVRITDTISKNIVKVQEETTPTGGHFHAVTKVINATASTTTTADYTWPFPISISAIYFVSTSDHTGDHLEMIGAPDTTIGAITQAVAATDTIINVSDTVVDNTEKGYYLKLSDGTNTDDLGRVLNVDKVNKTVTVETAAVNAFSAATPTYVVQTIYLTGGPEGGPEIFEIGAPWRHIFGRSNIGSSYVPAGMVMRLRYIEKGATTKKIVFIVEYMY